MSDKPYIRRHLLNSDLLDIVSILLKKLGYQPRMELIQDYKGAGYVRTLERVGQQKRSKRGKKSRN